MKDISKYIDGRINKVKQQLLLYPKNSIRYINLKNIINALNRLKVYINKSE